MKLAFKHSPMCAGWLLVLSCAVASAQTNPEPSASPSPKHSVKSGTSAKPSSAQKKTAHAGPGTKSRSATSHSASHKGKKGKRTASSRRRGQQKIDSTRAREIQVALIREHYLNGQPTGQWDDVTQKGMEKYQADHGWQSKTVPDARALIKLGLGPNHDHLLNPESAMTTPPVSHSATAPGLPPPSTSENAPQR